MARSVVINEKTINVNVIIQMQMRLLLQQV